MVCFGGSKKSKEENKGEREEEKTNIHPSSLGKPQEVVEKPRKWRWLGFTLFREMEECLSRN
jgi:hypothetical protein